MDDNIFDGIEWKFRPPSQRTLAMINDKKLWFACAETLNDPFESDTDILKKFSEALEKTHHTSKEKEEVFDFTQKAADALAETDVGILSLSKDYRPTPMWSYYAEDHSGIALGFKFDPRQRYEQLDSDAFQTFSAATRRDTLYLNSKQKDLHFFSWIDEIQRSNRQSEKSIRDMAAVEVRMFSLSLKSKGWKHEDEVRYFFERRKEANGSKVKGFPIGFFPNELQHIIFGLRTTKEYKRLIKRLIPLNDKYWNVRFWQARKDYKTMTVIAEPE